MPSSIHGAAKGVEHRTTKRLKNMTIGKRVGLGFTLVLILLAITATIAIGRLQTVSEATHEMMRQPLAKERLVSDWYRNVHTAIRRTSAIVKSADPTLNTFFAADIAASSKASGELQTSIKSLLVTDKEKALFKEIGELRTTYLGSRDAVNNAKADGKADEANRLFEQSFVPTTKKYLDLLQEFQEYQRNSIDATAGEIDRSYQISKRVLLTVSIFAFACCVACAGLITRGVLRQLGGEPIYAAAIVGQIAQGNLSIAIETKANDQSSLLFKMKSMRDSLAHMVAQARSGAETIAAASGQIASGNLDLSSRTERQARSLVETASSMDELTSTVKQNADHARQANQLALSASEVAVRGGAVVSQVIETMGKINGSAKKIADIIGVIDSLAFQTNLLALNAAVEAARAGEQGRGFAVVASEVRNLAQRSAAAAREIKSLIGDSVEKVDIGVNLVEQAGLTMDEIVESVKRVTHIMGEITSASEEQTAEIEHINEAVTQMDEATQQNLTLVEQASAAAEELRDQADNLRQVVSIFVLDGVHALAKGTELHLKQARPAFIRFSARSNCN